MVGTHDDDGWRRASSYTHAAVRHHKSGSSISIAQSNETTGDARTRARPTGRTGNGYADEQTRIIQQQQQISHTAIVSHSAGRYRRFQPLPGQYQHSLAEARRLHARRLPPTPRKPSTLQLASTNSINFPHVSASPTRAATLQRLPPVVRDHAAYGAGVVGVVGAAAAAAAAVASSRDRERDPLRRRMHEYNQYAPAAYEYRDREREQFERERNRELEQELEQDLERERWNSLNVFLSVGI